MFVVQSLPQELIHRAKPDIIRGSQVLHEINACLGRRDHQNPKRATWKPATISARFLESFVILKLPFQDLAPLGMQINLNECLAVIELNPRVRDVPKVD